MVNYIPIFKLAFSLISMVEVQIWQSVKSLIPETRVHDYRYTPYLKWSMYSSKSVLSDLDMPWLFWHMPCTISTELVFVQLRKGLSGCSWLTENRWSAHGRQPYSTLLYYCLTKVSFMRTMHKRPWHYSSTCEVSFFT